MIALLCTLLLVGGLLVLAGVRDPRPRQQRRRSGGNPALALGAGLAAGCLALVVTTIPIVACMAGVAASALPALLRRRREARRVALRAQAWPAVLDDVTSAVRAGMSLAEALANAGARTSAEVRAAFSAFEARYARTGDFAGSIEKMRELLDDRVFDQLAHALVMAREVGGHDLTQVLRSLSSFLRADLQIRGELAARQSWTVNSARIAVAAPWIVLVMLSTRPVTMDAYRTGTGVLVLVGVAITSAAAYLAMLRIARLEVIA